MELAAAQGFDVRVVALPPGLDPADAADGLRGAARPAPRATSCTASGSSSSARRTGRRRSCASARCSRASRTRPSARRRCGSPPTGSTCRGDAGGFAPRGPARDRVSPKLLEAGDRLERDALAGVRRAPGARTLLAELDARALRRELHRRAREHLSAGRAGRELVALLAELDARAAAEGIDERDGKQLLLRLRERRLRRELAPPTGAHAELQDQLGRVRDRGRSRVVAQLSSGP